MFKKFITKKELLPLFFIFIMIIFGLGFWHAHCLPDRIPTHWNAKGVVDGYSSKQFVFLFFPSLALGTYLLMLFLPLFDPLRRNYKKFVLPYYWVRVLLVGFLTAIYFYTVFYSLGYRTDIRFFIIPLLSLLFFGLGTIMPKIRKNYFIGVRTPWTLQSKKVWEKTHKLAGKSFILMAIVCLLTMFLDNYTFPVFIAVVLLTFLALVVYSYWLYRKLGLFK